MIKLLPAEYIDLISSIFNSIFNSGIAPPEWSDYQIIFIDKKDKERVRPIALSSCFGKLMERIIAERFNWWAEHNDKFNQKQNGFRRGRSCAESLIELTTFLKTGFFNIKNTMAVFLDISSAFDNVLYRVLINKLINEKCPSRITQFVEQWMYCRRVRFIVDSECIVSKLTYKGLPQGAVLSPILYDFYTNLVDCGVPPSIRSLQFADDVVMYCSLTEIDKMISDIEKAIYCMRNNLDDLGLTLQSKKTVILLFNKNGHINKNIYININNIKIGLERHAKFLGIWFDVDLSFTKQCNEVKDRTINANSMFKFFNRVSRGLEVNTSLMLYKSLIRSIADYGSYIFIPTRGDNRLKIE
ncbi:hypothetical protein CAJAP_08786 [Camponotus japonicus]